MQVLEMKVLEMQMLEMHLCRHHQGSKMEVLEMQAASAKFVRVIQISRLPPLTQPTYLTFFSVSSVNCRADDKSIPVFRHSQRCRHLMHRTDRYLNISA